MRDGAEELVREAPSYRERALLPILPLIDDPLITEISLNPDGRVWIERAGDAAMSDSGLSLNGSQAQLLASQLAGGQPISTASPIVSSDFQRGVTFWRVQILAAPVVESTTLALRRHVVKNLSYDELVESGMFRSMRPSTEERPEDHRVKQLFEDGEHDEFLRAAVAARWNILISGAVSSGKTTVMRALLGLADPADRIVTIEDAQDLKCELPNVVALRSAKTGPNTPNDLLEASLRLRPDRIVMGELRGVETWAFLEAINTGHPGAMATVHANSPSEAFGRLALAVMRAGLGLTKNEIVDLARDTLHAVVQIERVGGRRQVGEVLILR